MIKNNESETTVNLRLVEKKAWKEPHVLQLNVKETKSGNFQNDTEGGFWIFTWGPSS